MSARTTAWLLLLLLPWLLLRLLGPSPWPLLTRASPGSSSGRVSSSSPTIVLRVETGRPGGEEEEEEENTPPPRLTLAPITGPPSSLLPILGESGVSARKLPGGSVASLAQSSDHAVPREATRKKTPDGPCVATRLGSATIARLAPKYMPEVVSETERDFSCGGTHCASTVWMAGKMRP